MDEHLLLTGDNDYLYFDECNFFDEQIIKAVNVCVDRWMEKGLLTEEGKQAILDHVKDTDALTDLLPDNF